MLLYVFYVFQTIKNMNHKLYLFIFSLVFITACSSVSEKKDVIIKEFSTPDPSRICFSITNNSGTFSKFSFSLNDKFYASVKEIKDEIYAMAGQNKDSLYYYAWKFICDNTYSYASLCREDWIASPLLYMNSVGYGLCGKEAMVLSELWKELGYSARRWELNGHSVPEVYYHGAWHMLDPAYRVYYLNDKNEISDVQELSDNPDLITNPKIILKNDYFYQLRYSRELAAVYSSKEDNQLGKDEQTGELAEEFVFELPPYSLLEFPGNFMSYDPATINKTPVPYFANCRLKIPPSWEGKIKNALVLADIKGKGTIMLEDTEYTIGEDSLTNKISKHNNFIKNIDIGKHCDTVEIIYYLNPKFCVLNENNTFKFKGENINSLDIRLMDLQKEQVISERLEKQYFFYEKVRVDLLNKQITAVPACAKKNDTINSAEGFIASLENYCKCIDLENDETEKCKEKLTSALSQIPAENNLALLFEAVNCLPREIVYYDIIHSTEEQLLQVMLNLTKPV